MAHQTVRKASRKKARMRIGISAPAGAGKSMGALLVAYGLCGDWEKIGIIDTEQGSGELYVETKVPGTNIVIGEYLYWRVDAPFTIAKYLEGLAELEAAGCEVIILDSTSHAWSGAGGLLDKQGKIAAKSGNSYTAWRDVTPEHNTFVDAMLTSKAHIIATMRSKTEYVLETNDRGKSVPRKVGMAPVQREGMDYEMTVVFEIDQQSHVANVTKDRTALFDGEFFKLSPDVGIKMRTWLDSGTEVPAAPPPSLWQVISRDKSAKEVAGAEEYESEWRMRIRAVEKATSLSDELKVSTLGAMFIANQPAFAALEASGEIEVSEHIKKLIADAQARHKPSVAAEEDLGDAAEPSGDEYAESEAA